MLEPEQEQEQREKKGANQELGQKIHLVGKREVLHGRGVWVFYREVERDLLLATELTSKLLLGYSNMHAVSVAVEGVGSCLFVQDKIQLI